MKAVESRFIESQRSLGVRDFGREGVSNPVIISEVYFNSGHFECGIVALDKAKLSDMAGYAVFYTSGVSNVLIALEPVFMELKNLLVDSEWRNRGIGTGLLEYAKEFARSRKRKLILKPERPGELLRAEYRNREYPMTTEQLRAMYLRHGFRPFTKEEQEYYVRGLVDREFAGTLWFDGLDPQTLQFSDELHRERIMHGMGPTEAQTLAHIPLATKDSLCRRYSLDLYHHSIGVDSTWNLAGEKLAAFLVEENITV